jgi:hypothetical protein
LVGFFPFLSRPKLFGYHRKGSVIFLESFWWGLSKNIWHAPFLFTIGQWGCVKWWLKKFKHYLTPPHHWMATEICQSPKRAGGMIFHIKNDLTCSSHFWRRKNFSQHLTYPHCRMVTKIFWSP